MIKITLVFFMMLSILSSNNISLQFTGVKTDYINSKGEKKQITIEREIDPKCMDIHISNDVFWKAKYASNTVPKACKSTFITSAGKVIFPMQIHKDIETYGEMEVMALRKDFPVLMHQNDSPLNTPRNLCLYFEPAISVMRTWTPQNFLKRIKKTEDCYDKDEKSKTATLTEKGIEEAENFFKIKNLYDLENMDTLHQINQSLKAHMLFTVDKDYLVKDGQVLIVDEFNDY